MSERRRASIMHCLQRRQVLLHNYAVKISSTTVSKQFYRTLSHSLNTSLKVSNYEKHSAGGKAAFSTVAPRSDNAEKAKEFISNQATHISQALINALFRDRRFKKEAAQWFAKTGRQKEKIVVLGTGWASVFFVTNINPYLYDITIISPRNYFTFTPLLPSVCAGTLSPLSCVEPIRPLIKSVEAGNKITFLEALATDVDFTKQEVLCTADKQEFSVNYDHLLLAVGSDTNTFGIPGVREHCFFLKDIDHAVSIRDAVLANFEKAQLPSTSREERQRLLHFVIIGGGPTGVETAAEFKDMIADDISRYFPELLPHVTVTLVEGSSNLLGTYSPQISEFTLKVLSKTPEMQILLNHEVKCVGPNSVTVCRAGTSEEKELTCGFKLWASGVGQVPLISKLRTKLNSPSMPLNSRGLPVDSHLKVIGTKNVYAVGDCSQIIPAKLADVAKDLYTFAGEKSASSEWLCKEAINLQCKYPQLNPSKYCLKDIASANPLSFDDFKALLEKVDASYKSPVPTAQNAKQAGVYLANAFNQYPDSEKRQEGDVFCEKWMGSLAYVGGRHAVAHLPFGNILGGWWSLPIWKAGYIHLQQSWRNRMICCFDWIKVHLVGRDVGLVNMRKH